MQKADKYDFLALGALVPALVLAVLGSIKVSPLLLGAADGLGIIAAIFRLRSSRLRKISQESQPTQS